MKTLESMGTAPMNAKKSIHVWHDRRRLPEVSELSASLQGRGRSGRLLGRTRRRAVAGRRVSVRRRATLARAVGEPVLSRAAGVARPRSLSEKC